MSGSRLGRGWTRFPALAGLLLGTVTMAGGAFAAPPADAPEDRVLPAGDHRSEKAQALARRHAQALRDLNHEVYHCIPWLEVTRQSIGFFKPRQMKDDQRYLSIRVFVEQQPSPEFSAMTLQQRANAMFSRYVGPLLRRMTRSPALLNDDAVDGFNIIVEWQKAPPVGSGRPVHETIAVFVPKVEADEFLMGRIPARDLPSRSQVLAWDGDRPMGAVQVSAWDDDFVTTYKVKNYELPKGVTCQ